MIICQNKKEVLERLESCLLRHSLPGFSPDSPMHFEVEPFIEWLVEEDVLRWDGGVYYFNPQMFMHLKRVRARGDHETPGFERDLEGNLLSDAARDVLGLPEVKR